MEFRERRRWIVVAMALTATVPVLAILCRGHTPSRFDIPNLPAWERTPLPAAAPAIKPAETPLMPGELTVANCPAIQDLLSTTDDQLFLRLEQPGATTKQGDETAGVPGEWLEQASIFAANHNVLAQRLSAVSLRLLSDQNPDGYLGPETSIHKYATAALRNRSRIRYTTAQIAAHARNMSGLLAAFPVINNPALQYSAIRAGHFLLENYDADREDISAKDRDAVIYALTRLYLSTSDRDYLTAACADDMTGETSGVTLCALYQATGHGNYLTRARASWAEGDHSPRLGATLFALTGAPGYLENCRDADRSPWLYPVTVTRSRSRLSINRLLPIKADAGKFTVSIQTGTDESAVVIAKAPQTAAEIRTLPLYQSAQSGDLHPRTGDAQDVAPLAPWVKLRRWQSGDRIIVARDVKTASTAFVLKPFGNTNSGLPAHRDEPSETNHERKPAKDIPSASSSAPR